MMACLRRPLGLAGDISHCGELNIQSLHYDGGAIYMNCNGLEGSCEHKDEFYVLSGHILPVFLRKITYMLLSLKYLILKGFSTSEVMS